MKGRYIAIVGALGGILSFAPACGSSPRSVTMASSADIPAAKGTIKAYGTDNDNTAVEVKVRHLAPPSRVAPGATTYVVWALPPGDQPPQNLGALRVDSDLTGKLETVTALRNFQVIVTAEPTATVTEPSGGELLSANVERPR